MKKFRKKCAGGISVLLTLCLLFVTAIGCGGDTGNGKESIDMEKYPFYVEDYESIEYSFTKKEMLQPQWMGNVVYNETVMLIDDGETISGKLRFAPLKILSVRDYKWETEYAAGTDYTVDGNTISLPRDSSIPYLKEENLRGENVPAPYRKVDSISNVETDFVMMGANVLYTEGSLIYGHQVAVSYVYDITKLNADTYIGYDDTTLPEFSRKLKAKEDIKIAVIGDSVSGGCSSSKTFDREPYMDNFMELSVEALRTAYDTNITMKNLSVGGETSAWAQGTMNVAKIVAESPDVLFVHFGINDCGSGVSANSYGDNIESMILQVRQALPDCEIVMFNAFPAYIGLGGAYDEMKFEQYWKKNNALAKQYENIKIIDLWSVGFDMMAFKKYMDLTGNGINHLNDYSARLYAMAVCATFIEY